MKISKDWTEKERLQIVGLLSKKMFAMDQAARDMSKKAAKLSKSSGTIVMMLTFLLAQSDTASLESNRDTIMRFIE